MLNTGSLLNPIQRSIKEKGYYICPDFLSPDEHSAALDVCRRVLDDRNNPEYRWAYNRNGTINKLHGACETIPEFQELASHPKLIETARSIYDFEDMDIYISKFFPMQPTATSTLMHQDNYFFRGNPSSILSCAVYLEDTNRTNGCLRIVEGSHNVGFFNHSIDETGIAQWIEDKELDGYNIIDLEMKAPYAVFFDINVVHGCYVNNSNSTRFSLAWEYINKNNMEVANVPDKWCDRVSVL